MLGEDTGTPSSNDCTVGAGSAAGRVACLEREHMSQQGVFCRSLIPQEIGAFSTTSAITPEEGIAAVIALGILAKVVEMRVGKTKIRETLPREPALSKKKNALLLDQ